MITELHQERHERRRKSGAQAKVDEVTDVNLPVGKRHSHLSTKVNEMTDVNLPELAKDVATNLTFSDVARLESSPGRMSRTEVWISREDIVLFFKYDIDSKREFNKTRRTQIEYILDTFAPSCMP
jgi:hypothetical protein